MNILKAAAISVVALATLASCATQRYGRATPVSSQETALLTCKDIDLEIARNEGFLTDLRRQRNTTTGAHVLGALGDFGIGNKMEGDAAEESGIERQNQLATLRAQKGCA